MSVRKPEGALTPDEEKIAKALLEKGWRNQDIQAEINIGRLATVNSARITEVKFNENVIPASDEEVERFFEKKLAFDYTTGLNAHKDERLMRAREAMIVAVQIFNSAGLRFKTEVFSILANVAWTYLMHDYYVKRGVEIVNDDGQSLLLSQMLKREDCPLPIGVRKNLEGIKEIRDNAEHKMVGKSDVLWFGLFQACCLNFEKYICALFGNKLSLATDLSFALQFSKMNIEQLTIAKKYDLPAHIQALDARLNHNLSDAELVDLDYQFRVIYTLDAGNKSTAHYEFCRPDTAKGKEIRNVLVNYKPADELYPHKPSTVCKLVERLTNKRFTSHNHCQAWRMYKIRPRKASKQPENTNREFCIYHRAHGDYTYSQKWVDFLVKELNDASKLAQLKAIKL